MLPRAKAMPDEPLAAIQAYFHTLIAKRAKEFGCVLPHDLPQLHGLGEDAESPAWFPVPGMYGGFRYRREGSGATTKLICESWSRVCGGSGQRHEISASGWTLVEEGFA